MCSHLLSFLFQEVGSLTRIVTIIFNKCFCVGYFFYFGRWCWTGGGGFGKVIYYFFFFFWIFFSADENDNLNSFGRQVMVEFDCGGVCIKRRYCQGWVPIVVTFFHLFFFFFNLDWKSETECVQSMAFCYFDSIHWKDQRCNNVGKNYWNSARIADES